MLSIWIRARLTPLSVAIWRGSPPFPPGSEYLAWHTVILPGIARTRRHRRQVMTSARWPQPFGAGSYLQLPLSTLQNTTVLDDSFCGVKDRVEDQEINPLPDLPLQELVHPVHKPAPDVLRQSLHPL